jgi:hypothetical protein
MINLAAATIIVTIFSVRTAAGEEIGWRGYMLTLADRCRCPETCPGKRRDLGSLARATHPGRCVPGGSAAGPLGCALDGHGNSI